MSKERIRFTITSGNLENSCSCDCQKWIRHLAGHNVKTEDLRALVSGRFPPGKMFVLDMIEFLRKSDDQLHRFLTSRGGMKTDDLLSIDYDGVRRLLKREFPELTDRFATAESATKVIKRRPGTVDLSPLKDIGKKR